ncbi:MAG: hypothetical protein AAF441_04245 [Pseudomonadota bacterium]
MRTIWKWTRRAALLLVVLVVILLAPIGYVELACHGEARPLPYRPVLPSEHHRPESNTLMTYPEWHIVHAYDDYAEVIRNGDPHQYAFLRSIRDYWSSLCALTEASSAHGETAGPVKQMLYVIGVSFSVELLLKAAYEETVGRLFAWMRGPEPAALDSLSARHARDYASFLQQVPWYKWGFRKASDELRSSNAARLRDKERRIALGVEYGVKAAYADVIADAVAQTGEAKLTLRMVVGGKDADRLKSYPDIRVIGAVPQGVVIETPRYRVLTHLLQKMAQDGLDFVEIAGNDEIMFTVISSNATEDKAIFSFPRQGFGDYRHLILVRVKELAGALRNYAGASARLEHVHDY